MWIKLLITDTVAVFFEPTDRRKATKVLLSKHKIQFASPNLLELREMARFINPNINVNNSNILNEIINLSTEISRFIKLLIITIGSRGVVTIKNKQFDIKNDMPTRDQLIVKLYPASPMKNIENVSGAGDSFSSGVIHGAILGLNESQCISIGFKAARMTLLSKNTVSSELNLINSSPSSEEAHFEII